MLAIFDQNKANLQNSGGNGVFLPVFCKYYQQFISNFNCGAQSRARPGLTTIRRDLRQNQGKDRGWAQVLCPVGPPTGPCAPLGGFVLADGFCEGPAPRAPWSISGNVTTAPAHPTGVRAILRRAAQRSRSEIALTPPAGKKRGGNVLPPSKVCCSGSVTVCPNVFCLRPERP